MVSADMDTAAFLSALYGETAPGFLTIWTRRDKRTVWLPASDLNTAAEETLRLAKTEDVYFGVGLQQEVLDSSNRGSASGVIALPALWADIDVRHECHTETKLPPTLVEAAEIAKEFPLRPTMLVNSGHGLQAWWLLRSLWLLETEEERARATDLSRRFQEMILAIAARKGWKLDNTSDLARVLRPPGTFNRKDDPVPVHVVRFDLGRRYDPDDFEAHLPAISKNRRTASRGNIRVPSSDIETAASRYNADHRRTWPSNTGHCPACGHNDCFGQLAGNPDRWSCFSADHLAPGLKGLGCYHGDALDLDAHQASRSRPEHLRAEGYLAAPAPSPAGDPQPFAPRRLTMKWFRDIRPDFDAGQLVEGWLDHRALAVLYGAPGVGKSFLALDLGFAIATGREWFGRRVCRGTAVYVGAESPASIERRVYALNKYHRLDGQEVPLCVIPEAVNLVHDGGDAGALLVAVEEAPRTAPVLLIVVDTLAVALAGGDENSFEAMGTLAARLGDIRNVTGATVLGVHHSGKDETRGARGHSCLKAAVDVEIEVRYHEQDRLAVVTKSRDGRTGARVRFGLKPVQVAVHDGKPVEVAVVRHLGVADIRPELTGRRLHVLRALERALTGTPGGVSEQEWRGEYYTAVGGKRETARRTFDRARQELLSGWVVLRDGVARLATSDTREVSRNSAPEADRDKSDNPPTTRATSPQEPAGGQRGPPPTGGSSPTPLPHAPESEDPVPQKGDVDDQGTPT